MMWSNPSLNIPTARFRYIRFIGGEEAENEQNCLKLYRPDQPAADLKPRSWKDGSIMVMRFMLPTSSTGLACRFLSTLCCMRTCQVSEDPTALVPSCRHPEDRRNPVSQPLGLQGSRMYGRHIRTYHRFATIEDIDDGITSWWWAGVSSARHLIAKPTVLHLRSKRQVVNALALLSDSISIGDLVLYFHRDAFHWMLRNDEDVITAVTSAPAFTCNRILTELEMDGWDLVGTEVLSCGFESPIKYRKRYSLLFLILAEKSQRFRPPGTKESIDKVYSGQTVLDELWKARDNGDFYKIAKKCVNKWLESWGLDMDVMKKLMRPSESKEKLQKSKTWS